MDNMKRKAMEYNEFKLFPEGIPEEQRKKLLINFKNYLYNQQLYCLGYQANQKMNYDDSIKQFLDLHINNVGDPFVEGNYTLSSKVMEQAVLDYYAKLWSAVTPYDKDNPESFWGYTLSMGSTEGNVYAIWNARDYLSGKALLKDGEVESDCCTQIPVAFYSQDTHYSIIKAIEMLNFKTFYTLGKDYECPLKFPEDYPEGFSKQYLGKNQWPFEVPSNEDGSIHIPSLVKLVEFFVRKGHPIFVNFNYGTTFKGAYDYVEDAVKALVPILKENNMYEREIRLYHGGKTIKSKRNGFWFHVDGALGAAYMPFVEMAINSGEMEIPEGYRFPKFDFRIPEVNSIVMSVHKWIGSPYSCGLFMTKTKYQLLPPENPMYIGSPDTTFAGSRNGLVPMMLWDFLASHSMEEQKKMVVQAEMMARYIENKLKNLQEKIKNDLWVERSPLSLTVRFKKPNKNIIFKYSLSCKSIYVDGVERSYAHIFAMEHVSKELIDKFIEDLSRPDAFLEEIEIPVVKGIQEIHYGKERKLVGA